MNFANRKKQRKKESDLEINKVKSIKKREKESVLGTNKEIMNHS